MNVLANKLVQQMLAIGAAMLLLVAPLYTWREFYPMTDWAALILLPLAMVLWAGLYMPSALLRKATLRAALRVDSKFFWIFRGSFIAFILAALFTFVTIPVLAWQALTATTVEIFALTLTFFVTGILLFVVRALLNRHLHPPFAQSWSMGLTAPFMAFCSVCVMTYLNWQFISYPGELETMNFQDMITYFIEQLPARRGYIAEPLALLYALDGAKMWLVLNQWDGWWPGLLYSLDAALATFVSTRAFVAIVGFLGYTPLFQQTKPD